MAIGLVRTAGGITGSIVKVGDVCIIGHRVVKFYHRIFRLLDIELREVRGVLGILFLIHVVREVYRPYEGAGLGGVAVCVDAAHGHEF